MNIEQIQFFYKRDLEKLKTEINLYNNENNLWITDKNISNSAGNLCLHLIGNLNHFIGAILGATGYVRNRDLEFSQKNIPRVDLILAIDKVAEIVNKTLEKMTNENLNDDYPEKKFDEKKSIEYLLLHLQHHLNYHLGQINYHRRIFDK